MPHCILNLSIVTHHPVYQVRILMKRIIFLPIFFLIFFCAEAQLTIKEKKYPSLLWEITGKGLAQPSYLIGTMHVSSKLAFNLPDSFYVALRKAQVVALETNPETWQADMNKYDLSGSKGYNSSNRLSAYTGMPNDYLTINTLKFFDYYNKIEQSLYSNPSTINSLLYRSYGNETSDFEEDTYLDMYIFQCGKKWGKKVAGVEDYGESMRLMAEAYKDAANDKNKKDRSYSDMAGEYSADKLQEAYRSGNLDQLDSINKYNSVSEAFDEKFLYQRNYIQANSIDSIIKSGSVLFVGVGAAHLPGDRGVIEILRSKGYKLRPVKMGERASREKDMVDKIRVPVTFRKESSKDGFINVDIPGTFYKMAEEGSLDQWQYADMANGSYYMYTRIMTNAWMWNHSEDEVYKKLDSLLYENVPGKIITKATIVKNGHKGIDVTSRTRRGDLQRYNMFITPFEIIFFKMSGNGDYVKLGEEANKFFGSIQLKEYKNAVGWKKYSPSYGGFAVDMPQEPFVGNDGSWIYDAEDKKSGNHYRVIKTSIHNYRFAEEDTFDLGLMDESFMASEFIDTQLSCKQTTFNGYPALDATYRDKKGNIFLTRFLIQGPHYYTLIAHGKKETTELNNFLSSFEIMPFVYEEAKLENDTALYFSVRTPVFPVQDKIKIDIPQFSYYGLDDDNGEELSEDDLLEGGAYRNKIIKNDSTGEKIMVTFYRLPRYYYSKDSSMLENDNDMWFSSDSTLIVREKKRNDLPNGIKVWETVVSDTGSSRSFWAKVFYKDGIGFTLMSQTDTLSKPSSFIKSFYESFTPVDTLKGVNPFEKKTAVFFNDFFSNDSIAHKRAVSKITEIEIDSSDMPQLKKAIASLNWSEKKYLDTKKALIAKFDKISTKEAALYLKDLYYSLDDTIQLQYPVLETLLQQKTAFAFNAFREIVTNEPPVLDFSESSFSDYGAYELLKMYRSNYSFDNGNFLDELSDTLQLTKAILPDLLPLLNLEDYKSSIMKMLGKMVDSGLVQPTDYEIYYSKFLIEAKQELRKQSIAEKKKSIAKAEENKLDSKPSSYLGTDDDKDIGNADLNLYATLLLPFWDSKPAVKLLIEQMLRSNDKELKFNTLQLLRDNKKSYPDTLMNYFAGLEEYRYELYSTLKREKQLDKFPAQYNNHLDLGKSALMESSTYNKPDSVVYLDRMQTTYNGKKGFIYFFQYKHKKDDVNWKLATVGLVPENPLEFEFEDDENSKSVLSGVFSSYSYNKYNFTSFTETKIKSDESLNSQLKLELKKMLYSRRNSAKQFYGKDNEDDYED